MRFTGIVSGLQRVAFYGIVSLFIGFFAFDLAFSSVLEVAFHPETFSDYFHAYMFWSIVAYPTITVLYALGRKYFGLGPEILRYNKRNLLEIVIHDVVGNIIIPFIFVGMLFDSIVRKQGN